MRKIIYLVLMFLLLSVPAYAVTVLIDGVNYCPCSSPVGQVSISIIISPSNGGIVAGSGIYNSGSTITMTATPTSGYTFSGWAEGSNMVSISSPYIFMATSDRTLIARFIVVPPTPPPSGALGSKTNPIRINKWSTKGFYIPYLSPNDSRGDISVPAGSKWYFEVDPLATTGKSVPSFLFMAKFFSGGGSVCKLTQDKITGSYTREACSGSTIFADSVFDNSPYNINNTKFLYAIDNSGGTISVSDQIWAVMP